MSSNEKGNLPPSYSESTRQPFCPDLAEPLATNRGQNILDRLTLTRAHTIRSVIDNNILPVIEAQAADGISQTTLALLPSDIPLPSTREKKEFGFDAPSSTPQVQVISFSGDEEPEVIRLEGQVSKTEFWRMRVVTEELERTLRQSLGRGDGLYVPMNSVARQSEQAKQAEKGKRKLFSRVVEAKRKVESGTTSEAVAGGSIEEVGQISVSVRLEEICLRTVNDFGLYDTLSSQCVIVRVDVGC